MRKSIVVIAIVFFSVGLIYNSIGSLVEQKRIEFLEHRVSDLQQKQRQNNMMVTVTLVDTEGKVTQITNPTYIRFIKTPDGYWALHSAYSEDWMDQLLRPIYTLYGNKEEEKREYMTGPKLPRQ
jgi:hypothetical protein